MVQMFLMFLIELSKIMEIVMSLNNQLKKLIIASPKGEANNRIRRKKKAMSLCLYVCMYVTLHSSGVLRHISDFLVLKTRQKICGATRTKIILFT
jgi:hypothetical protein